MTTIERKDLINAVLRSREEVDPALDAEILEAVVEAEADAAGDGESALRAIGVAVAAAIARGVGRIDEGAAARGANGEEIEEDGD